MSLSVLLYNLATWLNKINYLFSFHHSTEENIFYILQPQHQWIRWELLYMNIWYFEYLNIWRLHVVTIYFYFYFSYFYQLKRNIINNGANESMKANKIRKLDDSNGEIFSSKEIFDCNDSLWRSSLCSDRGGC